MWIRKPSIASSEARAEPSVYIRSADYRCAAQHFVALRDPCTRAGLLRSMHGKHHHLPFRAEGLQSVIAFMVNECCDGDPELCNLVAADAAARCSLAPTKRRARKMMEKKAELAAVDLHGLDRGVLRQAYRPEGGQGVRLWCCRLKQHGSQAAP